MFHIDACICDGRITVTLEPSTSYEHGYNKIISLILQVLPGSVNSGAPYSPKPSTVVFISSRNLQYTQEGGDEDRWANNNILDANIHSTEPRLLSPRFSPCILLKENQSAGVQSRNKWKQAATYPLLFAIAIGPVHGQSQKLEHD
jgi:hypothetical protein